MDKPSKVPSREDYLFDYPYPFHFYQSRWAKFDRVSSIYFGYRALVALYFISIFIFIQSYNFRLDTPSPGFHWIYLTNWTNFVFTLSYCFDSVIVIRRFLLESIDTDLSRVNDEALKLARRNAKASWILSTLAYPLSFTVAVAYWCLLYEPGLKQTTVHEFWSYNSHLAQALITIFDMTVTPRPWRLMHFWTSSVFGVVYIIFQVIYILGANGTNSYGDDYVYPVLKWKETPGKSIIMVVLVFIANIMMYLWLWLYTRFLNRLEVKCLQVQQPKQKPALNAI